MRNEALFRDATQAPPDSFTQEEEDNPVAVKDRLPVETDPAVNSEGTLQCSTTRLKEKQQEEINRPKRTIKKQKPRIEENT